MDEYSPKNRKKRLSESSTEKEPIVDVPKTPRRRSTSPILQDAAQKASSFLKDHKMKIIAVAAVLAVITCGTTVACLFRNTKILQYPLHASCNVTWTFKTDCGKVQDKLVQQIGQWKTNDTCGTGQKCLYDVVTNENGELKATHTTPKRGYIDDMTFKFYPNTATNGCTVVGYSTSRLWYAVLDYGTNYCNLHNLIEGAGLHLDENYSEVTEDSVCTQYTSSDCEKY